MSSKYQHFNQNKHEAIWIGGISLALSETAKHKCRALSKIKGWLNIVIHSNKDPVIVILNINQKQSIKMTEVLSNWCLYKRRMTQQENKQTCPSQREALICTGARAQALKTEIIILGGMLSLSTQWPRVLNIFHATHAIGGSQTEK